MKIVSVVISVVLLLTVAVPGVFAYWRYSLNDPDDNVNGIVADMGIFSYPPEEILPDDEEASDLGINHWDLIQKILHEPSYGLNATKKPIIHTYLTQPGAVVYCSQHTTGGNLKHLMIDSLSSAQALYFVITEISDTEYHTFTFTYRDATDNPVGTEIVVYKTIMVKGDDKKWSAPTSYYGYAKVNDPGDKVDKAIDVTSWRYVHKS